MIHLTDDQLDDILIGDASSGTQAHLDACDACTTRLAAAQAPMVAFNAASIAWGERRSATLPLQLRPHSAGLFTGGRLRIALGAAVAAVFTLALVLPLLHHGSAPNTAHQASPQTAPTLAIQTASALPPATTPDGDAVQPQTAEQQQIARDNQLLQAIDRELASSETPADLLKMVNNQKSNQSSPDRSHND